MSYIFFDESGDLGFDFSKKKTTKHFLATFLLVKNKKSTEKIVKKIFQKFTKRERRSHCGALHAFKEKKITRVRLLKMLNEEEVGVFSILLDKKRVHAHLKDEKHILYHYVVNILLDRIIRKKLVLLDEKIYFVASKKDTSRFLNENFKAYLEKQLTEKHAADISINIKTPPEEKCLQVVDMASWALFRKYEHGDASYSNIFTSKILEENFLFE